MTQAAANLVTYDYDARGRLASTRVFNNCLAGTFTLVHDGWNPLAGTTYAYGPFGELTRATGPMAKLNPIRFSTKYQDDESDLVYYGCRFYNASTGRWLNRDPLGDVAFRRPSAIHSTRETIERNLYWFVMNNPNRYWDYLGLDNPGCDKPADRLTQCPDPVKKDCRLRACAKHDKCYYDNNCKASSWATTWLLNWLDGLITTPCQNCNNDAIGAVYQCELGGPSNGPRWFCANGPSAGTSYNDYSQIPASCWEDGVKPPAP
jgi:RHS repeat-associated protein